MIHANKTQKKKKNLQIVILCVLLVAPMLTQRSRGLSGESPGKNKKNDGKTAWWMVLM